ncbi:Mu transposase C-terminal domain-containing protein [Kaistia dalseonensis]|uniref:Transposase InsO family protein n=1 Tax=Kaistia dalseonensis TaxID=410840 RepID=A0ABU0HC93_9HYPH|nr:transposase domain-containing protein [Kaistia dalseonensis]MCX5497292.1 Mu transposase C-terminal domain-containing protein [Kaistia dalseonensis]MDQ0439929.1 transposase InsO family protein [Kaistia dalseonensis]
MTNDNSQREWWTAAELAAMRLSPEVPATERGLQLMIERNGHLAPDLAWPANPLGIWRRRSGKGGGREYRMDVLPVSARTVLARRLRKAEKPAEPERVALKAERSASEQWTWFDGLPEKRKAEAKRRMDALLAVADLQMTGRARDLAMMSVASAEDVSLRTLYGWAGLVAGLDRKDWLPALAPRFTGRTAEVEIPEAAWQAFLSDYLRGEVPTLTSCLRRLEALAKERGWTLPSEKTFERRVAALPRTMVVLAREGVEALRRLYPAQERDRSGFHALEGVNADGHKFDVFAKWPDGTVSRPILVGFQDLYSGMILSWRIAASENAATVLLAFGDLVENWGIPEHCWLDNGRNFASKWFTGGTPNRYRFKVREGDPNGVLTALGVEVHWTTPYSGQSKPIERAWRDFADSISRHPAFAGAWTGNTIDAKPENYGSTAVPIETFEKIVAEGVAEHNSRLGRKSKICGGRHSFAQVFNASYGDAMIRKASPEQCRLWLLAAEGVTVRKDGSVHLEGNRYWHERLIDHVGHKVVLRFDPDALHDAVHVYRLDGAYLVAAPVIEAVGFADTGAARDHARARKSWIKAQKELLKAERRLSIDELAAMLPTVDEVERAPSPKVIKPTFGNLAAAVRPSEEREFDQDENLESFGRGLRALRLVPSPNEYGADE